MSPQTILVPLDTSETSTRSIRVAKALSRAAAADITLMTTRVVDDESAALLRLEKVAEQHNMIAPKFVTVSHWIPAEAILDLASDDPEMLVCMTTHSRSPAAALALGSVTSTVIHSMRQPFVLVGPSCQTLDSYATLLVALDGSEHSAEILPFAIEFAAATGLRAQLVIVDDGHNVLAKNESLRMEIEADFVEVEPALVLQGDPGEALVEATRATPNAIIAMATHGHSAMARLVVGSVTSCVVQRGIAPVFTVRPKALA